MGEGVYVGGELDGRRWDERGGRGEGVGDEGNFLVVEFGWVGESGAGGPLWRGFERVWIWIGV